MKTKLLLLSFLLVFLMVNTSFTSAKHQIIFTKLDSKTAALSKINNACINQECIGYFSTSTQTIYVWAWFDENDQPTYVDYCSTVLSEHATFYSATADSYDLYTDITNLQCSALLGSGNSYTGSMSSPY